jgi:hypothetical protein
LDNTLWILKDGSTWEVFTLEQLFRKFRVYSTQEKKESVSEPPMSAIPTDILQITDHTIKVVNPADWKTGKSNPQINNIPWFRLSSKIMSQITGEITMIMPEEDIAGLIQPTGSTFEFASDGGHKPSSGKLTFGWVVASINKTIIAQGRGPVPCHPQLAESFRSEGFGLASVGLFAGNLINQFEINTKAHRWLFYIDNKSMIQRLDGYSSVPTPRWNLRPDEDISKIAKSPTRFSKKFHIKFTMSKVTKTRIATLRNSPSQQFST